MLYNLLVPLAEYFQPFNLFRYITFRTGGAILTSLVICWITGPALIRLLRKKQEAGQPILSYLEEMHAKKKGTPTMGGSMMLIAILISTLLWADVTNLYVWLVLMTTLSFGLIGATDDYNKLINRRNNAGLSGRTRLILEFIVACAVVTWAQHLMPAHLSHHLALPFFKDVLIDLGYFYVPLAALVVVGAANAVNFTDGLDGLASMPVMIAAAVFIIFAYLVGSAKFAEHLQLHHVPGTAELAVFCGALVGAALGFLWYNAPPAQVIMGDTGSLALGGALGAVAVFTKHELVLALVGGIFVAETLSVIIQVASFKMTGKRVFKMAPLHHHFEKIGWPESTIVVRFWIIAIVLALLGLSTLKLR